MQVKSRWARTADSSTMARVFWSKYKGCFSRQGRYRGDLSGLQVFVGIGGMGLSGGRLAVSPE